MSKWIRMIGFLVWSNLWLAGCIGDGEEERGAADLQAGDKLPEFAVEMNNGEMMTREKLAGKTSLVVFFHTGCSDCRQALPVVQHIYEDYAGRVNVVCISRAEKAPEIASYWASERFSLPYSAQPDRIVYQLFAGTGVPRIYVSDASLVIRKVFTDKPAVTYEDLASAIDSLP